MIEKIRESVKDTDTEDVVALIFGLIGTMFATNGITSFYGQDLSTMLQYDIAGFSFTAATLLIIGAAATIAITNDLSTEEFLDYNSVEGAGFLVSTGAAAILAYEPQFITDNVLNDPTGGFVYMVVIAVGLVSIATQPHWSKQR